MYNITKNVIEMGRFNLTDILRKIDSLWIKSNITDSERVELYALAQSKARTEDSVELIKKISELEGVINNLKSKIDILELKINNEENANENIETEEPENVETPKPDVYNEFVAGQWYYCGDKITFNGKYYECIAPEGVVCVWNPNDYPPYWKEI